MKVWINDSFTGHYPVGTAAVVVAETAEQAAELLNKAMAKRGLHEPTSAGFMRKVDTRTAAAVILCDGDY